MKPLKHIAAFILLAALLLPVVTAAVLQLQQWHAQWQMAEDLEQKQLITISVSSNNIQWLTKGKECFINGELFDVKQMVTEGTATLLTGLYDSKEKEIKQKLHTQTSDEQSHQKTTQLVKLQTLVNAPLTVLNLSIQACAYPKADFALYKSSCYKMPFCGCTTPPPKFM